ncbi:hypothetical protein B0H15DRAFT_869766 [Mycena belliarum]|uniref:Uncharacterized protein n=1 Tax=Mycena belliarum TaxID=1033014 RepID=A0AAD6TMU8_9AGAR|nr:hypothetical protein B0H15DRAFT_869766 [Mycena belliae]
MQAPRESRRCIVAPPPRPRLLIRPTLYLMVMLSSASATRPTSVPTASAGRRGPRRLVARPSRLSTRASDCRTASA